MTLLRKEVTRYLQRLALILVYIHWIQPGRTFTINLSSLCDFMSHVFCLDSCLFSLCCPHILSGVVYLSELILSLDDVSFPSPSQSTSTSEICHWTMTDSPDFALLFNPRVWFALANRRTIPHRITHSKGILWKWMLKTTARPRKGAMAAYSGRKLVISGIHLVQQPFQTEPTGAKLCGQKRSCWAQMIKTRLQSSPTCKTASRQTMFPLTRQLSAVQSRCTSTEELSGTVHSRVRIVLVKRLDNGVILWRVEVFNDDGFLQLKDIRALQGPWFQTMDLNVHYSALAIVGWRRTSQIRLVLNQNFLSRQIWVSGVRAEMYSLSCHHGDGNCWEKPQFLQ